MKEKIKEVAYILLTSFVLTFFLFIGVGLLILYYIKKTAYGHYDTPAHVFTAFLCLFAFAVLLTSLIWSLKEQNEEKKEK